MVAKFLLGNDMDGDVRLQKLLEARYEFMLENPKHINLRELTDIVSAEDGNKAGFTLDAVFASLNETPAQVVITAEASGDDTER